MVLGVLAVLSVSLADTYFVGQLGTDELAALSFTFPVVLTISSLSIGLSAGASSIVSRSIGGNHTDDTRRLATDSLVLALVVVAVVCAAGLFAVRPLFSLLGAQGRVLDIVVEYMRVWFFGMPFLVVPMVGGGLIRANGDSIAPSLVMVGAAVINVGLDRAFVFGAGPLPALGVAGAAWASLVARACALLAMGWFLIAREKLLSSAIPRWADMKHSWARLLKVGVPAAGSNMVNPIAISVVTAVLATFGKDTVAAFGVATRLESFAAIPMLALSSAIGPIAGQNWGDDETARTKGAMRAAFIFCLGYSVLIAAVFWLAARPLVEFFSDDPEVVGEAATYLRIVGATLGGYGVIITASAAYNAIGEAVRGLGFTLLRSAVLYVPLASASVLVGTAWVAFGGIAAANALSGALVLWLAFRWLPASQA